MMTTQNHTEKKNPTQTIYSVKQKGEGEKSDRIKVGAAWENADQMGLNLSLDILGQRVSLTVRKDQPKPE